MGLHRLCFNIRDSIIFIPRSMVVGANQLFVFNHSRPDPDSGSDPGSEGLPKSEKSPLAIVDFIHPFLLRIFTGLRGAFIGRTTLSSSMVVRHLFPEYRYLDTEE